jgi:peptide/nickel transport system substrate-binding protein
MARSVTIPGTVKWPVATLTAIAVLLGGPPRPAQAEWIADGTLDVLHESNVNLAQLGRDKKHDSGIVKPRGWALISVNHKAGLMASKPLRQAAVQAALDMEPIMAAGFGHKDFYKLGPALFFAEQPFHSGAGAALYNQKDKDKARRLMKEAGYARQTVRYITTKDYDFMYKTALVAKQQLEELGFVIDLQVVDWATLNQRVQKPELWELYTTGYPLNPDPALHVAFRCSFQGWWCHEEKERLLAELKQESDLKKRKALVDRMQALHDEDVGQIKLGDYNTLDVARRELRGEFRTAPRRYFWNSWLAQ